MSFQKKKKKNSLYELYKLHRIFYIGYCQSFSQKDWLLMDTCTLCTWLCFVLVLYFPYTQVQFHFHIFSVRRASRVHVLRFFFPAVIINFSPVNSARVHCSWDHKLRFLTIFPLKMGLTVLFTHLKIILLQCFLVFNCIQTDPWYIAFWMWEVFEGKMLNKTYIWYLQFQVWML